MIGNSRMTCESIISAARKVQQALANDSGEDFDFVKFAAGASSAGATLRETIENAGFRLEDFYAQDLR